MTNKAPRENSKSPKFQELTLTFPPGPLVVPIKEQYEEGSLLCVVLRKPNSESLLEIGDNIHSIDGKRLMDLGQAVNGTAAGTPAVFGIRAWSALFSAFNDRKKTIVVHRPLHSTNASLDSKATQEPNNEKKESVQIPKQQCIKQDEIDQSSEIARYKEFLAQKDSEIFSPRRMVQELRRESYGAKN